MSALDAYTVGSVALGLAGLWLAAWEIYAKVTGRKTISRRVWDEPATVQTVIAVGTGLLFGLGGIVLAVHFGVGWP
jgi:hypothetical protein